eukprot:6478976-Amphidinium_carterae.1
MSETTPAYVPVHGRWTQTSLPLQFLLRGTIFSDGCVYWNADELLQQLSDNPKLRVARWFSREGKAFLEHLGGSRSEHYLRSHLAARNAALPAERTTQEFSMSSLALFKLCLWWSAARSTSASKSRGQPMLAALIASLLSSDDLVRFPVRLHHHVLDKCDHRCQAGVCLHVQTVLHGVETEDTDPLQRRVRLLLSFLHYDCKACHAGAASELDRLATCVNERARASTYSTDVSLSVNAYTDRGRKRRIS